MLLIAAQTMMAPNAVTYSLRHRRPNRARSMPAILYRRCGDDRSGVPAAAGRHLLVHQGDFRALSDLVGTDGRASRGRAEGGPGEIGRASCRESVEGGGVGV